MHLYIKYIAGFILVSEFFEIKIVVLFFQAFQLSAQFANIFHRAQIRN